MSSSSEVDSGPRPIEGVGTATAAFVVFAPDGPANQPVLVTNWSQYVEKFGKLEPRGQRNPHMPDTYLSHAVYGYFLNGGGRCYVIRVAPPESTGANGARGNGHGHAAPVAAEKPTLQLRSAKQTPALTIGHKDAPTESVTVEVAPPTGEAPPDDAFTLRVKRGDTVETYENVTLKRGGQNVAEQVRQKSKLITCSRSSPTPPSPSGRPWPAHSPSRRARSPRRARARPRSRCSRTISPETCRRARACRGWRWPRTSRWSAAPT